MAHKKHTVKGIQVPSVTTVLDVISKPGLYYWYGKHGTAECERVKRESAAFGGLVHDAIEGLLKTGIIPSSLPSRALELVKLFSAWRDESGFTPLETELSVTHEEDMYGGTFDALGTFASSPKTLWLLDWKTSNEVYDTYALQLAAYAAAYNHERKLTWATGVSNGGVIRMAKDPGAVIQFEPKTVVNLERFYPAFKQALALYNFANKKGEWKNASVWTA